MPPSKTQSKSKGKGRSTTTKGTSNKTPRSTSSSAETTLILTIKGDLRISANPDRRFEVTATIKNGSFAYLTSLNTTSLTDDIGGLFRDLFSRASNAVIAGPPEFPDLSKLPAQDVKAPAPTAAPPPEPAPEPEPVPQVAQEPEQPAVPAAELEVAAPPGITPENYYEVSLTEAEQEDWTNTEPAEFIEPPDDSEEAEEIEANIPIGLAEADDDPELEDAFEEEQQPAADDPLAEYEIEWLDIDEEDSDSPSEDNQQGTLF